MSEQAVYARLSAITGLGGRVYPMVLPQNVEYPAATFQRITTTRYSGFGRDASAVEATIQVDIYSPLTAGYGALSTLSDSVRGALQRVATPTGTPPVYDAFIDAERDDYEDDTELLRKSFDVRVWYEED